MTPNDVIMTYVPFGFTHFPTTFQLPNATPPCRPLLHHLNQESPFQQPPVSSAHQVVDLTIIHDALMPLFLDRVDNEY